MNNSSRGDQLRKYFAKLSLKSPIILAVIGLLIIRFIYGLVTLGVLLVLIGIGLIIYRVQRRQTAPSDETVDEWLEQDLAYLINSAREKTDLAPQQIISKELVIKSPILWNTKGINQEDLVFRKGKDKYVRFGVYRVTIFLLAEHLLAAYMCDYNFIKKVQLNERTEEYHYRDIISVTTEELSTSYTLPDGSRLIRAQAFRLSVASGETIQVLINSHHIAEMTRGELPATGAENVVKAIRTMLREKKV